MLIIMHHGNIQLLLQTALNLKAFRRLNILQINAAKSRCNRFDCLNESIRIVFIDFYIKCVYSCIYFEQEAFPLHDRFSAHGTNVTQAQYCSSI